MTEQSTPIELHPELRDLAGSYGIATEFWDWLGRPVAVTAETIIGVLAALDVDAATPDAVARALTDRRLSGWRQMLPSCLVIRERWSPVVAVHVDAGSTVGIWIDLEDGGRRDGLTQEENWEPDRDVDGRMVGEASFRIPGDLPLGYHTFRSAAGGVEAAMPLIVTCLLYTSPSPRDATLSRMPSSA